MARDSGNRIDFDSLLILGYRKGSQYLQWKLRNTRQTKGLSRTPLRSRQLNRPSNGAAFLTVEVIVRGIMSAFFMVFQNSPGLYYVYQSSESCRAKYLIAIVL
jgi:hypothetical protein